MPKSLSPNLLPTDGEVFYYGCIFSPTQAGNYFEHLMHQIAWQPDEALMFGKRIITKRKVAWYGNQPYEYRYSKLSKYALPWTNMLLDLKKTIEQYTAETYNSCLLNLYHNGSEGMAYHSDAEPDLKKNGAIASLSFGAERRFLFKHKQLGITIPIFLEHGSLLMMQGCTQTYWQHRLPPSKKITTPRINLTFRTIERLTEKD